MPLDYPIYEEMVRRGSNGRWVWRIGSWLYYAGLLGIILLLIVWPVVFFFKFGDVGIAFGAALLLMAGMFVLGNFLIRVSFRIAAGEGLDISKYSGKAGDGDR